MNSAAGRVPALLIASAAISLFATASAADLAPELEPLAQTHKTASESLAAEKAAQLARIRQPYVAALISADRSATTAGDTTALRAIAKERDALEKGAMRAEPPADLPNHLAPARRAMISAVDRFTAEFAKREKEVDADYLRKLSSLQSKAAGSAALTAQIESEKRRVLEGISGPVSDLSTRLAGTKWRLREGRGQETFEFRTDGTLNGTWRYEVIARDKVTVHWSKTNAATFTLGKEGNTLHEGNRVWSLVAK